MLNSVEHGKSFITSEPGFVQHRLWMQRVAHPGGIFFRPIRRFIAKHSCPTTSYSFSKAQMNWLNLGFLLFFFLVTVHSKHFSVNLENVAWMQWNMLPSYKMVQREIQFMNRLFTKGI